MLLASPLSTQCFCFLYSSNADDALLDGPVVVGFHICIRDELTDQRQPTLSAVFVVVAAVAAAAHSSAHFCPFPFAHSIHSCFASVVRLCHQQKNGNYLLRCKNYRRMSFVCCLLHILFCVPGSATCVVVPLPIIKINFRGGGMR